MDCLFPTDRSHSDQRTRGLPRVQLRQLLWVLLWVGSSGPATGQVLPIPPAVGPVGEIVLSPPQSDEAVIYHVGLVGLLNKASLQQIEITLSALAPPLSAAFDSGDIKTLRLVESANHVYGDADDVVLNTVKKKDIVTSGGITVITDDGNATPVGLFPLPVGVLLRHYFVVAQVATSAKAGHAFRVSAAAGHITMSMPPQIGLPVPAVNANRVVVDSLLPAFGMTPASLDFGTVAVGDDSSAVLQISNTGAANLILSSLGSADARFAAAHASLPGDLVVPPGGSAPLTVTFTPDTGGSLATTLDLVHNDVSSPTQVSLSGSGVGSANLAEVLPASVDFGNIKYGATGQSSFNLINNGASTITINSIQSSDPQFTCSITGATLAPGETRPVALYFSASSLGTKTAALSIQQDGVAQPFSLPLRADATVALNIGSLNFGSIAPGKSALLPLTIDNPSAAPVTITSIVSDNPAFTPDCSSCVIGAGASQTIYVTFRPTTTQPQSARLSITHNPTLIVNLAANGFNRDFSQTLDADGKPLLTLAVPFGGEWLAALLFCLYAVFRRRVA